MSPGLQAKLLRVLQEREFELLGAECSQRIDVRVIAATNRDLRQLIAQRSFQEDLYYRLNVIPIEIPPLRERWTDIPVLVEHFTRKHAQRAGKRIDPLEDVVLKALQAYDWPGNIKRAREYDRAGGRPFDRAGHCSAAASGARCRDPTTGRAVFAEPPPESGMGGTRDRSARPGVGGRSEKGRG